MTLRVISAPKNRTPRHRAGHSHVTEQTRAFTPPPHQRMMSSHITPPGGTMRTHTTHTTATLLTTAAMLAALTGCLGDSEVTTSPNKPAASQDTDASKPPAEDKPAKPKVAKVGDTISLTGTDEGLKVDATLKKWLDPAKSADEFDQPADGKRWVAAQFELVNTGTVVYDDSPSNGTQVADGEGQRFGSWYGEITAGPQMTSSAKVPPGEKVLGWIVYEVPKTSKLVTVQFGLDSGFAEQTGQWAVK